MRKHLFWACLVLAGCGGGGSGELPTANQMEGIALNDVSELYRVYTASKKKPPESLADFQGMDAINPNGYQALKTGEIILRYGATMADAEAEGPATSGADEVLAYQKKVPESGGMVLMLDRTTKTMTADEFKSAKKAGKG